MSLRDIERQVVTEEAVINNRFLIGIVERAYVWRGGQGRYFLDVRVQTPRGEVFVANMPAVLGNYHEDDWVANILFQGGVGQTASIAARGALYAARYISAFLQNFGVSYSTFRVPLYYGYLGTGTAGANADSGFRAFLNAFAKHVIKGMRVLVYCPTGRPSEEAYYLGTLSVQSGLSSFIPNLDELVR